MHTHRAFLFSNLKIICDITFKQIENLEKNFFLELFHFPVTRKRIEMKSPKTCTRRNVYEEMTYFLTGV